MPGTAHHRLHHRTEVGRRRYTPGPTHHTMGQYPENERRRLTPAPISNPRLQPPPERSEQHPCGRGRRPLHTPHQVPSDPVHHPSQTPTTGPSGPVEPTPMGRVKPQVGRQDWSARKDGLGRRHEPHKGAVNPYQGPVARGSEVYQAAGLSPQQTSELYESATNIGKEIHHLLKPAVDYAGGRLPSSMPAPSTT